MTPNIAQVKATFSLKVPKCEILVSWILMIFIFMKSQQVGDLRTEIKILHFLQMGKIRVILFLLQVYASNLLMCAHCPLAIGYRMRSVR